MSERVEVDPNLSPVAIAPRLFNEMAGHARETVPEECCGLVTGDEVVRFRHVHRCRNEMTRLHHEDPARYPRDGREAFHMNEHDYLAVSKQAEAQGERVTAVYHSHPGIGVYFSELDQEYAAQPLFPFPQAEHIVLSVVDGRVGAGLFRRSPAGFVGCSLVPENA